METLEAEDTATDPKASRTERLPSGRPLQILAWSLAVIVIAALVVSVLEWRHYAGRANQLSASGRIEASAVAAAHTYGVDVGSYNYANLHGPNAPWTQIEDHSTAAFKSKYETTTADLQSTVVSYKATATASVEAAAVSSLKGSQAVVLVEIDQTINNSTQKGAQSETFLVTMTLQHQKGQWLISDVQASV